MTSFVLTKPVPAAVTGLIIQSGVKTSTLVWDAIDSVVYEVWLGLANDINSAVLAATTVSNSYAITGLTADTYFWVRAVNVFGGASTFTGPVQYVPGTITSADVQGTLPTTTAGFGVGTTASSYVVPAYDLYYYGGYGEFTPSENSLVNISMHMITTISNVSCSSGQTAKVWIRTRLYDGETEADVPGAVKTSLLYHNNGTFSYGNLVNVSNFHETFVTGFRGLLVPGHTYYLLIETMKTVTGGATLDLTINQTDVSSSGSATF